MVPIGVGYLVHDLDLVPEFNRMLIKILDSYITLFTF